MDARQILKDRRTRNAGIVAVAVAAHLGVFAVMGRAPPTEPLFVQPIIDVVLLRPPPPPPPPPPPDEPARDPGGGAPAAPSRIHVPPPPQTPVEPELPAPVTPAPQPDPIVVGVAPTASPTPGFGQGGEGTGTGTGTGAGSGPGSGTRARLIRGPSSQEIVRHYPREAFRAGLSGRVMLTCRVRLDTRLEACRVSSEDPTGHGFGPAAVAAAGGFRFAPPTEAGRPVSGAEINVGLSFERRR